MLIIFYWYLVPGGYTEWSDWSECSKTCGDGLTERTRNCTNPAPEYGGATCAEQGLGEADEYVACNEKPCASE